MTQQEAFETFLSAPALRDEANDQVKNLSVRVKTSSGDTMSVDAASLGYNADKFVEQCAKTFSEKAYAYGRADGSAFGLYRAYRELADREERVIFGGRLGEYRYCDMQDVIPSALALVERELRK